MMKELYSTSNKLLNCQHQDHGTTMNDSASDSEVKFTTEAEKRKTNRVQKRKYKSFCDIDVGLKMSSMAQEAQKREKERLERLDRNKKEVDDTMYTPFVMKSSELTSKHTRKDGVALFSDGHDDDDNDDLIVEKIIPKPQMKEVIELGSSEDEQECSINSHQALLNMNVLLSQGNNTTRFSHQYRVEKLRTRSKRARRHSAEYDQLEITPEGRLLINAGKPEADPDVFVAPHLTHVLQPHQIGGVRFMYDNVIESLESFDSSDGFGCILAHSMGLGKTIQAIAFTEIFIRVTNRNRVLIMCPVNVLQNWNNEFEKWMPEFDTKTGSRIRDWKLFLLGDAVKTTEARINLINTWHEQGGVLIIGYEMFRLLIQPEETQKKSRKQKTILDLEENLAKLNELEKLSIVQKEEQRQAVKQSLLSPGPDLVICDEGHRIKNLNTHISHTLSALHTRRRIVLTGYPLQNNLMEYYSMIEFVRPSYLGTRKDFLYSFEKPIKNGQCIDSTQRDIKLAKQKIHVLTQLLRGFVQRRSQHLLKKILPESREFVLLLRKAPIQHALYRAFHHYATAQVNNFGESCFNALKAFAICMKIVNHPDLLYEAILKKRNVVGSAMSDGIEQQGQSRASNLSISSQATFVDGEISQPTSLAWSNSAPYQTQTSFQTKRYPNMPTPMVAHAIPAFNRSSFNHNSQFSNNHLQNQNWHMQTWEQQQAEQQMIQNSQFHNNNNFNPYGNSYYNHQQPRHFFPSVPSCSNYQSAVPDEPTADEFYNHLNNSVTMNSYMQLQQQASTSTNPNVFYSYRNYPQQSNQQQRQPCDNFALDYQNGNAHERERHRLFQGTFLDEKSQRTDEGVFEELSCKEDVVNKRKEQHSSRRRTREVNDLLSDEFLLEDASISLEWAELLMKDYVPGLLEHSSKLLIAMELVKETIKRGEKLLLFSQSVVTLNLIEIFLKKQTIIGSDGAILDFVKNKTYCRFDGTTSGSDREKLIRQFNENRDLHLFLISTRAGSLGVNLVSANRVIIFDVSWNPCHDAQAICRIYRYGQKRKTFIYRLIMGNSMEKQVFNRQISKQGLQKQVVDEQLIDANVTTREVQNLMEYNESLDVISSNHFNYNNRNENDFDDDLLLEILKKNERLLMEEPFLHESMMLEREEGLSQQEKLEALMLFQREKQGINFPPAQEQEITSSLLTVPTLMRGMNGIHNMQNPFNFSNLPSQSTPLPKNIELAELQKAFLHQEQEQRRMAEPKIMINAEITLPKVIQSEGTELKYTLYPGTSVARFISSRGNIYLRTSDGVILDATNSPFVKAQLQFPMIPARMPPKINTHDEVIQIDD